MGLMSGGQFGEMHRWLQPIRDAEPDMRAWDKAWVGMATQQEDLASADLNSPIEAGCAQSGVTVTSM
jgi:hypothetical protein